MMPNSSQVLIVGAGPTGLMLALQLARYGTSFRIIDKNSGPGLASRAMGVHARTLEFYAQLGLADEIIAQGIRVEHLCMRKNGQKIAELTFKDMGKGLSPYPFLLSYAQDDHERLLVKKLHEIGVSVEWNTELISFKQEQTGVRAILEKNNVQETCAASFLCGSDGARSRVREGLELGFPGGTYNQLFFVADVKIDNAVNADMCVNLSPTTFMLMIPVRSTGMWRIVGAVPAELSSHDNMTFEDIRQKAEHVLGVTVAELNWFSTYRSHHRVAAQFRVGRCFILGDAGHIHSPAGGQGMNTGIGDAVNLGWKLAHVIQGRAQASILDSYESERMPFARKLVETTDKVFQIIIKQGFEGRFLLNWLYPYCFGLLTRSARVRRKIFQIISQVRISYRHSALSEGCAGSLKGGDRLPWVLMDDGDNFSVLRLCSWQLHVYGDAEKKLLDAAANLGIAIHRFAWSEAAAEAGLTCHAGYLVRPDGYVGLILADQNPRALDTYVAKHGLKMASPTGFEPVLLP